MSDDPKKFDDADLEALFESLRTGSDAVCRGFQGLPSLSSAFAGGPLYPDYHIKTPDTSAAPPKEMNIDGVAYEWATNAGGNEVLQLGCGILLDLGPNGKTMYYPGAILNDPVSSTDNFSTERLKNAGSVGTWKPKDCIPVKYDADCNPIEL